MNTGPSSSLDTGQVGERVVCQWLRSQGFKIQDERWHCRFGELDIVALEKDRCEQVLAFVEVKARQVKNWDGDGAMAITQAKQRKLIKTAQLYLGTHPQFDRFPCRFDVALVQVVDSWTVTDTRHSEEDYSPWVYFGHSCLCLKHYIRGAFEAN